MRIKLQLFALVLLLAGCAHRFDRSEVVCWSSNIQFGSEAWLAECEHEFHKPVLLLVCHGGYDYDGNWKLYPDFPMPPMKVSDVAWMLKSIANGREVVLASCNARGTELNVPGVYYSRQTTAAAPWIWYPGWLHSAKQLQHSP